MKTHFQRADLQSSLPEPGYYRSTIRSAQFRTSARGNHMVEVIHTLTDVDDEVPDYFVLEGVSPKGAATSRRRLVELYRACGREPVDGDPIVPEHLLNAQLDVLVDHDQWRGRPRLKVVGYRTPWLT